MFTLVETFFFEVNLEVSNFYLFRTPPLGFYGLALILAILTQGMPGLFAYKLVAYKNIQNIDPCFLCYEGCQMLLFHLQ